MEMKLGNRFQFVLGVILLILAGVMIAAYLIYDAQIYVFIAALSILFGIMLVVRTRWVLIELFDNPKKRSPQERRRRRLKREKKERREKRNRILLNILFSILTPLIVFAIAAAGFSIYGYQIFWPALIITVVIISIPLIICIWKVDW